MAMTTYHIKFDEGGKATVTRNPPGGRLKKDQDTVKFTFEGPLPTGVQAAIRFRATSPFAQANEPEPKKEFLLGSAGNGPFLCVNPSPKIDKVEHHFDCGRMVLGEFKVWEGT